MAVRAERCDGLAAPRGNPEQLQRVLFNLIQNAIRHTPPDGSRDRAGRGRRRRRRGRGRRHRRRASSRRRASACSSRSTAPTPRATIPARGSGWRSRGRSWRRHGGAIWLEDAPVGTRVRFRLAGGHGICLSTRLMSRSRARSVPLTVPVTFERAGARMVGDRQLRTVQPAAAARRTISSGQPKRRSRDAQREQRLRRAARIGPRSRSGTCVRRRSSRASSALAAGRAAARRRAPRGCARRARGRRRRRARRPPPAAGRAGSNEASQSMKQTTSSVRGA